MSEGLIADIFDIEGRFLRSAHLERDFYDSAALAGYIVTDFARSSLSRIGEGLKPNSGQRAWRITGQANRVLRSSWLTCLPAVKPTSRRKYVV